MKWTNAALAALGITLLAIVEAWSLVAIAGIVTSLQTLQKQVQAVERREDAIEKRLQLLEQRIPIRYQGSSRAAGPDTGEPTLTDLGFPLPSSGPLP